MSKLSMFLFIFLNSYIAKYHIPQSNNIKSMLLIIEEKIESHGRYIEINSIEGKGCTLEIQILFERSLKNEEHQDINCR
ncbi:hypothetical protein [Tepidibacter aestuarii]|uniref:hypothetical protein n=1 Tax=Tepidibacter aestuarii TaxID=2925782 RepID=UPI0020BE9D21|nr:hypothetical protein [Tepidibacter aestuarii]